MSLNEALLDKDDNIAYGRVLGGALARGCRDRSICSARPCPSRFRCLYFAHIFVLFPFSVSTLIAVRTAHGEKRAS